MTKHVKFGGSTAARTLACPAWVTRSETVPKPGSNSYADEGSMLHEVMERCMETDQDPEDFLGYEYKSREGSIVTFTEDHLGLANSAWRAANKVLDEFSGDDADIWIEPFVNYGANEEVGGSIDVLAINAERSVLVVLDYKFGRVEVPVEGNKQLMFYAMCALTDPKISPALSRVDKIVNVIIQPMVSSEPQIDVVTRNAVRSFARSWEEAMADAKSDNPTARVTESCRYCPYRAFCPEQRSFVDNSVTLSTDDAKHLSVAYGRIKQLKEWIDAVEKATYDSLEQGAHVPGYKLVPKRATRRWADPESVMEKLKKSPRFKQENYCDIKLKTPAALEKYCKQAGRRFSAFEDLITNSSSGATVAPLSDKREAVNIVGGTDALAAALKK